MATESADRWNSGIGGSPIRDLDVSDGFRDTWAPRRSVSHIRPVLRLTDEDGDDVGIQREEE
jgi:hypothetical protein